jgi:hypothetical protein
MRAVADLEKNVCGELKDKRNKPLQQTIICRLEKIHIYIWPDWLQNLCADPQFKQE